MRNCKQTEILEGIKNTLFCFSCLSLLEYSCCISTYTRPVMNPVPSFLFVSLNSSCTSQFIHYTGPLTVQNVCLQIEYLKLFCDMHLLHIQRVKDNTGTFKKLGTHSGNAFPFVIISCYVTSKYLNCSCHLSQKTFVKMFKCYFSKNGVIFIEKNVMSQPL